MSKTKRPVIKGRGADIFLGDENPEPLSQQTGMTTYQHTSMPVQHATAKATFYLDENTLDTLDDLWLKLRRLRKDATKSGIVNEILKQGIADKLKQMES
ncbi:MAG: hypothetical protein ABRQ34_06285 [Smithellaceae bacterium]|jgi:hypothetical protein